MWVGIFRVLKTGYIPLITPKLVNREKFDLSNDRPCTNMVDIKVPTKLILRMNLISTKMWKIYLFDE